MWVNNKIIIIDECKGNQENESFIHVCVGYKEIRDKFLSSPQ